MHGCGPVLCTHVHGRRSPQGTRQAGTTRRPVTLPCPAPSPGCSVAKAHGAGAVQGYAEYQAFMSDTFVPAYTNANGGWLCGTA